MSLIKEIKDRLKVKATGVNLSNKRIEAIATFIDGKVTTEDEIDAALDTYAEYRPFADIAKEDDRERLAETKTAQEKEAAKLKAIEDGKAQDDPNETAQDKLLKQILEQNKALFGEIASIKGEKVVNTWKSKLEENLKGVDEKFKATTLKAFNRMKFENDEQFDEYLTEISTDAKDFVAQENQFGGDRPAGGARKPVTKEASKEEAASVLKSIM
jgi:hypothetical protein